MTERYFRKFPLIDYSQRAAVDITVRTAVRNRALSNPYLFYPYDVVDEQRADQVADRFYSDPYMSWVLYMSNDIIDPLHEWYLSPSELQAIEVKKYGSFPEAQERILYYRNNWYENSAEITASRFAALSVQETKYWEPRRDDFGRIQAYKRRTDDWIISTNKIVRYEVANGLIFSDDERVNISLSNGGSGTGQVARSNATTVDIQHLTGIFLANTTHPITASSNVSSVNRNVSANLTSSTLLANVIGPGEETYWSPVTAWDKAEERNAEQRSIRIMDKNLAFQAARDLEQLMRE